jgi:serpin B
MRKQWVMSLAVLLGICSVVQADEPKPSAEAMAVAKANNGFFLDIYRKMTKDQNLFISPYSLSSALVMVSRGAAGTTGKEMTEVLKVGASGHDVDLGYANLRTSLEPQTNTDKGKKTDWTVANSVWVEQGHPLVPAFAQLMHQSYGADLEQVEFADGEKAAGQINHWVETRTAGQIKTLIEPASLSANSRVVIVNAVNFKGSWLNPFKSKDTRETAFETSGGMMVNVQMMQSVGMMNYASDEKCQVVELPYVGEKTSMLIIAPVKEVPVSTHSALLAAPWTLKFEQGLTTEYLETIRSKLHKEMVQLHLPKWKMTQEFQGGAQSVHRGR